MEGPRQRQARAAAVGAFPAGDSRVWNHTNDAFSDKTLKGWSTLG
jgi:hypothetical protein